MQRPIFVFSLLLLFRFLPAQEIKQDNIAIIKSLRAASNAAIAKHDVEGISKYWLNDFVQVRGNATYLTGKDTIIASWKKLFNDNPKVLYVRTASQIIISTNDTLAWETGTWKAFNSYSNGGNYSAMWRNINGSWKLQAELFVSLE
jgi:ketosteroid isomerase-like protein